MFRQELQIMSKMSRMTSYDQLILGNKICHLIPTLLDFQILVRKLLPFATIVSLAIFYLSLACSSNFLKFHTFFSLTFFFL